jgi:hypothetical protein
MSLDKLDEAIPVDTHVFSIAKDTYGFFKSAGKSDKAAKNNLSDKAYKEIGDQFRQLWGKYAGWAQTIMFVDDLSIYRKSDASSPNAAVKGRKRDAVAAATCNTPMQSEKLNKPKKTKRM